MNRREKKEKKLRKSSSDVTEEESSSMQDSEGSMSGSPIGGLLRKIRRKHKSDKKDENRYEM
jgi:hypothetical protein